MSKEKAAVEEAAPVQAEAVDTSVATEARETSVEDMSPEELQAAYDAEMTTSEESSDDLGETADAPGVSQDAEENGATEKPVETKATVDDLASALAELRKKQENLELAYQRGQEELGQHRKWRREFLEKQLNTAQGQNKPADYADNFDYYGDRAPARNEFGDHDKETRKQLWELAEIEAAEQALRNRQQVSQLVPDFGDHMDTIVEFVKALAGNSPTAENAISKFRQNPYLEQPQTLVFAAQAAKERKKAILLEAKLAEMEKRLSDLSNNRTAQIRRAQVDSRMQPKIGARSGQSVSKPGFSKRPEDMTLEELEKAYKQSQL